MSKNLELELKMDTNERNKLLHLGLVYANDFIYNKKDDITIYSKQSKLGLGTIQVKVISDEIQVFINDSFIEIKSDTMSDLIFLIRIL